MSTTLYLLLDRAEGSLVRLLGLIERRGFHIDQMVLTEAGSERNLTLKVRGSDGSRSPDVLKRQIDRLYGMRRVACDGTSDGPDECCAKGRGQPC